MKNKIVDDTLIHTNDTLPLDVYGSHYSVNIYCANCSQRDSVMVKKGKLKDGLSITCTNCGCKVNL